MHKKLLWKGISSNLYCSKTLSSSSVVTLAILKLNFSNHVNIVKFATDVD